MVMSEMLPCPFCGRKEPVNRGTTVYWIECPRCLAQTGEYRTEEQAMKAWNARAKLINFMDDGR